MIEMTEAATILAGDSYVIATTECEMCFSLQPCLTNGIDSRCADWQACRVRQGENRQPDRLQLTPADQVGLLEITERMQAKIDRLERIASAARVFVQASEAFDATRGRGPVLPLHDNLIEAEKKLIKAVKGGD